MHSQRLTIAKLKSHKKINISDPSLSPNVDWWYFRTSVVSFSLLKICQIGSQAETVGLQISKTFQNL